MKRFSLVTTATGTTEDSAVALWMVGSPVEIASFDRARISWDLLSKSSSDLQVAPFAIYTDEPYGPGLIEMLAAQTGELGLHVTPLVSPPTDALSKRYVAYGLAATKASATSPPPPEGPAEGTPAVESGSVYMQVDYK